MLQRIGETETFDITIAAGQDTYVHTFTGTYNTAPIVDVETLSKRVSSISVTPTQATIVLVDTDGATDTGFVIVQ